jgi:hypothetical protein
MRISSLLLNLYPLYYKLVLFIGLLPLIVYPFSEYYWIKSEYESYNHGPLWIIESCIAEKDVEQKFYGYPGPLAYIMGETYFTTAPYIFCATIVLGFYQLFTNNLRNSIRYFKIIWTYLQLGFLQFIFLYWMFE